MRSRSRGPAPRALLEHESFLRRLSRSLLRDEGAAEDNVQQTLLTALEHPPRHALNLRAWLGTVARRLAMRRLRASARRTRRERRAPRRESPPGPEEIAEQLETQRKVVEAVASLEEPYRSVIVLRYLRGRRPKEIAREQEVPLNTVKTRLRRALEQLRARLDDAHDGDREIWCLALAPFAARPRGAAGKTAAAAAAVVGAAGLLWFLQPDAELPASAAAQPTVKAKSGATGGEGVRQAAPPPPGCVAGAVHLESGRTRAARVLLTGPVERESLGDGFFFEDLPPGRYTIEATHEGFAWRRFSFDLGSDVGAGPFDILLKTGGALLLRVVGPWETPVPEDRILVRPQDGRAPLRVVTGADGSVLVEHLAPGPYMVERDRTAGRSVTVRPGRTVETTFVTSCALLGSVIGADDRPLEGAVVRLLPTRFGEEGYRNVQARTDAAGAYGMEGFPAGAYDIRVQVLGERGYVAHAGRIFFREGDRLDRPLHLAKGVLGGRITRADNGDALDRKKVQVTARPVPDTLGHDIMAFADAGGRFVFVGLLPGTYRIWIASHDPALGDAFRTIDFQGGRLEGVDFALEPRTLACLRLSVIEPDGTPATGLLFSVATGPHSVRTLHPRQVGDGVYELWLEVGDRRVSIHRKGVRADDVEVTLAAGDTVERDVQLREHE